MIILLAPLIALTASPTPPVLRAIGIVESANKQHPEGDPSRHGREGELGLYQFTLATWRQHTSEPFVNALIPGRATAIAKLHLAWLAERLRANGIEPTTENLILAWPGYKAVINHRVTAPRKDYGQRTLAIYQFILHSS